MSLEPVISWSKISKGFGRRVLFSGVSGEILPGQRLVVTGANGSGKSTFLRVVAGLLAADSGEVSTLFRGDLGYCAPSIELYGDLTGSENLLFFARAQGMTAAYSPADSLSEFGLTKASNKLYASYSSGMKQRLKLALSVLNSPKLLILDEPTLALDSVGVKLVDQMIELHRQRGGAVLIATNDQNEAQRWADNRLEIGPQAW